MTEETAEQHRRRRRREQLLQLGAYVLIVLIGVYGFWSAGEARKDSVRRGDEHRQITANSVCGVAQLIRDLITPAPGRTLSDEQRAFVTHTLARLAAFERDQLDQLGKSCQPQKGISK